MHQRLVSCQILSCIDDVRHQIEKHYMDLVAMRQDTKHINRLGFLQRCRLKTGILVKKISLKMNNANLIVKHHLHREVLNKRNRFKKKQGSIELSDEHDLGTVKIIGLIDGVDARGQVRDINIFIKDQKRQRHIEHLAENHRLITLDHDHDVDPLACRGFALADHLGHLVRRALMRVFRHNRRAPGGFCLRNNLFIADCNIPSRHACRHATALVHMFDHEQTINLGQWLSRKAGRAHAQKSRPQYSSSILHIQTAHQSWQTDQVHFRVYCDIAKQVHILRPRT